jgi:CDP-diacylglycerol---glycerol-3-phosphate 3-phosphatidyltransferase
VIDETTRSEERDEPRSEEPGEARGQERGEARGQEQDEAHTPRAGSRMRADGRARQAPTAAEVREIARNRLIESRLTPNAISLTGLLLNVVAAVLVTQRLFFLAGVAFIAGSLMDMLDGRYSRMSGKGTPFGAFLDSTLDRVEEGVVLAAVAAYFADRGDELATGAAVLTVVGSYMVSYTRARAEALGVECKVGIATRAVRVVILSAGLLFAKGAGLGDFELLEPAIYLLAGLTILTTFQRVLHVRRQLVGPTAA